MEALYEVISILMKYGKTSCRAEHDVLYLGNDWDWNELENEPSYSTEDLARLESLGCFADSSIGPGAFYFFT